MYRLLANPEHIAPLRQEIDAVVAEEGWTKAGIDKMHKVDSFLRESQRVDGLNLCSLFTVSTSENEMLIYVRHVFPVIMTRLALRPFTFSNGVTVPAGTLVTVPASAIHADERNYPNPDKFDGFRFSRLRESEGNTATSRYQAVSTSTENLAFGLGRHTW